MSSASLPTGFSELVAEACELAAAIPGYTTAREAHFLALLGACPTARGAVLEIGSYRGRSTVLLARAAAFAGQIEIHAVDPMFAHAAPGSGSDALEAFQSNLERAGVTRYVRFHRGLSNELAREWTAPLRLLWIDGDHRYDGVKADVEGYARHLVDGAIVAMDDVLHPFTGCLRVFIEEILDSDLYGPVGLCGAIGWAQHNVDPSASLPHAAAKRRLRRRLVRLLPFMTGRPSRGLRRVRYNFLRATIPHGPVDPREWIERVRFVEADPEGARLAGVDS